MNKLLKNVLLAFISIVIILKMLSYLYMGRVYLVDRGLYPLYTEYAKDASKVFLKHGICEAIDKCGGRVFFKRDIAGGLRILIYGVQEENVLNEFSRVFVDMFHKSPDMQHLAITAYSFSHEDYLNKSSIEQWRVTPILNINISRDK